MRNYKKKGREINYDPEAMKLALKNFQDGTYNVYAAAKVFNFPPESLRRKYSKLQEIDNLDLVVESGLFF